MQRPCAEVYLLNVQAPVMSGHITRIVTKAMIENHRREEGEKALREARRVLERAGVPFHAYVMAGRIAETIVHQADKLRCGEIVMGTRGMGSLANLVLGSVATKVVHLAKVPVTLVK